MKVTENNDDICAQQVEKFCQVWNGSRNIYLVHASRRNSFTFSFSEQFLIARKVAFWNPFLFAP